MRKVSKLMSRTMLILVFALVFLPLTAKQAEAKTYKYKQTWVLTGASSDTVTTKASDDDFDKVSVTSSNKAVIKVLTAGKQKKVKVKMQKAGKAVLTYKFYKANQTKPTDIEKITVKVMKYVNPVSSFKVGGKDLTSKFKKPRGGIQEDFSHAHVSFGQTGRINMKLNKGWKMTGVTFVGDRFESWKPVNTVSKLNKVKLINGDFLYVHFQKGSTKLCVTVVVDW